MAKGVRNRWLRKLLCGFAAACWIAIAATDAAAQSLKPTEYQVKAAFLFNFAKFVDWPDSAFGAPDAPFVIGVLGSDPFGVDIDIVKSRTINGRKVQVQRYQDLLSLKACHILFVSASESGRLGAILKRIGQSSVLLVSDMDRFTSRGGMINFITRDNSVGFIINTDAAARAGLTLHSRLLKMAVIVHDDAQ